MNILSLYDLNSNVASNSGQFICGAEELYKSRIQTVAEHLSENCEEMPIILISGPSGSGKTTTALRLGTMLEQAGKTVHTVSMDNYFIPIDDPRNEVDEDGHIDLESPKRLDIDLLNDHLSTIGDIAFANGFNDISYFNRCFKKAYGLTPKQYREYYTL